MKFPKKSGTVSKIFTVWPENMINIFLKGIVLDNSKIINSIKPINNYLAILAQFKNEGHILKEWADHCLWQGLIKYF